MEDLEYWVLVGFGALFLLVGSALLYPAYNWQQRVKRSFFWPTVQGRVLKSGIDKIRRRADSTSGGISYHPNVEYEYTVDDVLYTHDHIEVGGTPGYASRSTAEKHAANYPIGRDVPVYFDPENASTACLERRSSQSKMMIVIGVASSIGGVPMILFALQKMFRIW